MIYQSNDLIVMITKPIFYINHFFAHTTIRVDVFDIQSYLRLYIIYMSKFDKVKISIGRVSPK